MVKRVLLFGEAGKGKSVLAKKITLDWCFVFNDTTTNNEEESETSLPSLNIEEQKFVKRFKILIFIDLSKITKDLKFVDIIKKQIDFQPEENANKLDNFLSKFPEQCLLLLDAYDELDHSASKQINEVINGKLYPHVYVLITSRPNLKKLPKKIEKECAIHGFSEELAKKHAKNIFKVVEQGELEVPGLEGETESKLKKLMLNPFICTCLCMLKIKDKLTDEKITSIFNSIVQLLMGNPNESDEDSNKLLLSLGSAAFDALIRKKTTFYLENSVIAKQERLKGLVATNSNLSGNSSKELYSFEHQPVQDFLAAVYVAHSKKRKFKRDFRKLCKYFRSLREVGNGSIFISFICGLNPRAGGKLLSHIQKLSVKDNTSGDLCPQFSSYAWTKQQLSEEDKIMLKLCDSSNITPFILDCLSEMEIENGTNNETQKSFPYKQANISKPFQVQPEFNFSSISLQVVANLVDKKQITFRTDPTFILANMNYVTDEEFELLDKIQNNVQTHFVETFHMTNANCIRAKTKFHEWISKMKKLHCLEMFNVAFKVDDMVKIMDSCTKNLKQLCFDHIELVKSQDSLNECKDSLPSYLKRAQCLQEIVLKNFNHSENKSEILSSIKSISTLQKIDLTKTDLSTSEETLSNCFANLHGLSHLTLDQCKLSPKQLESLSDQLKSAENIVSLNVSRNIHISDSFTCFATAVRKMTNLQDLSMDDCCLKAEQINQIFEQLPPALRIVSLNNNNTDHRVYDFLNGTCSSKTDTFKNLKYILVTLEETNKLKELKKKLEVRKLYLITNEDDEKKYTSGIMGLFEKIGYVCK